uniref:Solute carrier family 11 (proton-coupled divalent metal ion transporters), member 2 n=1 Tax=Mus musculus TaxID=10090 RepID=D6RGP0_MOUSE
MALLGTMETLPALAPSTLPTATHPSHIPLETLRSPSPPTLMRKSPFLRRSTLVLAFVNSGRSRGLAFL